MLDFLEWKKVEGRDESCAYYVAYLPFYVIVGLLKRVNEKKRETYYLMGPDDILELTGDSSVIRYFNRTIGLHLKEEHVAKYLKFFCYFLHVNEHNFIIVEDKKDRDLDDIRELMDTDVLDSIRPMRSDGKSADNRYLVNGYVRYGDVLFNADYAVAENGEVEIRADRAVWQKGGQTRKT